MTSFTTANVSALPVVAATTSRLVNILERFVVPVAAGAAGFISGKLMVFEVGEFLSTFVPGIQTMDNWIFKGSKSGTVTVSVALALSGIVIMVSAVWLDKILGRLGQFTPFDMMLRRGLVAFLFGAGVRALAESFAPFKGAIEAFSEVSVDTDVITNGGDSRFTFEELRPIPTPPIPTPPEDEGKLVIDGQRGGGGGERGIFFGGDGPDGGLTPIPGGDGEGRADRRGRLVFG